MRPLFLLLVLLSFQTLPTTGARAQKVVLMIHGAGGGGWEFDKWRPEFESAGWTVVARDLLPANGGLAKTRVEDYVRQVKQWVPAKRDRLVIVGASMGGLLGLKASEELRPDAVVLVNSVAPSGLAPAKKQQPSPPIVRWANGPIKDTRDALPDGDEETVRWAHPKWRNESGAVMNALRGGVGVSRLKCPCLVVIGEKDSDVPASVGLKVAAWARADLLQFAGMSHIGPLMGKRRTEVARSIIVWLEARGRVASKK